MNRHVSNITLQEAYERVRVGRFGIWKITGNYMGIEEITEGEKVETLVFMSPSIFLLGLSVAQKGFDVMGSGVDFVDIWPSVKTKYPQLFKKEIKGELLLIP